MFGSQCAHQMNELSLHVCHLEMGYVCISCLHPRGKVKTKKQDCTKDRVPCHCSQAQTALQASVSARASSLAQQAPKGPPGTVAQPTSLSCLLPPRRLALHKLSC